MKKTFRPVKFHIFFEHFFFINLHLKKHLDSRRIYIFDKSFKQVAKFNRKLDGGLTHKLEDKQTFKLHRLFKDHYF